MTKHIVILADKYGRGSYGSGDTEAEALKKARQQWPGGKVKETRKRTVEVPADRQLVFRALPYGVEWWTEPVAAHVPA